MQNMHSNFGYISTSKTCNGDLLGHIQHKVLGTACALHKNQSVGLTV